jgi:hypothetical protein
MAEEIQDANNQPSSELEGAIASSPEAIQEAQGAAQTPPAEQGETQPEKEETPLHEHPRFKEVVDEKNWYKQQLEQIVQRQQQPTPQPQAPQTDPYAGMTAEERVFWQKQREIAREEAQKVIGPQVQQGIQEIARLRVEQFQRDHPDVKANSPEETQIATKIRQGYLPEDAYRAVMWDKKVGQVQQTKTQQQQQRLQQKRQANVVSPTSVSPQAAPSSNMSFEDELRHRLNTEWDGTIE